MFVAKKFSNHRWTKRKVSMIHRNHLLFFLPSTFPPFFDKNTSFPSVKASHTPLARNYQVTQLRPIRFFSPGILNFERRHIKIEKYLELTNSKTRALLYFWITLSGNSLSYWPTNAQVLRLSWSLWPAPSFQNTPYLFKLSGVVA